LLKIFSPSILYDVPEPSTLVHIANLAIQRVLVECTDPALLTKALEEAYPFGDLPEGREIWVDALLRNGIENATTKWLTATSHAVVLNVMPVEKKRPRCKACGGSDTTGTTD
jgi:hypothetical protein